MSGYYLENYFREKGIRYIAINDNMDTNDDNSYDMLSFKLSFNDYYPRDISKKIRKVKRMKQIQGQYQARTTTVWIYEKQDRKEQANNRP